MPAVCNTITTAKFTILYMLTQIIETPYGLEIQYKLLFNAQHGYVIIHKKCMVTKK